ncbi:MAG: tetratricopeptide repeat protein [Planctomycetaceae bacterium]|nr:tetratricopeptide repeat protein [Planctomycetaceae bacterium]
MNARGQLAKRSWLSIAAFCAALVPACVTGAASGQAPAGAGPAPGAGQVLQGQGLTDLQRRVNEAITKGAAYLRSQQGADGGFGNTQYRNEPGCASLCLLTLRKCGATKTDPAIKALLPFMMRYAGLDSRDWDKHAVYNCGIMLLALDSLCEDTDDFGKRVHKRLYVTAMANLGTTIVNAQADNGGWGYKRGDGNQDLSNTQYAVLGLWAVSRNKIAVPKTTWLKAAGFLINMQNSDGGFTYRLPGKHRGNGTHPMTAAGIGCLGVCILQATGKRISREDIAGTYLSPGNKEAVDAKKQADEAAAKAKRKTPAELAIERGFDWLDRSGIYQSDAYYLYGLERACALTQTQKIGKQDWYEVVANQICLAQRGDGSWSDGGPVVKQDSILATCWNLLVLVRATEQMLGNYYPPNYVSMNAEGPAPVPVPATPATPATPALPDAQPPAAGDGASAGQGPSRGEELLLLRRYIVAGDAASASKLITAILRSENGEGADPNTENGRLAKIRAMITLNQTGNAMAILSDLLSEHRVTVPDAPAGATPPPPVPPAPPAPATPPAATPPAPVPVAAPADGPSAAERLKTAKGYLRSGQWDKAKAALEELIKSHPDNDEAKEARKLLNSL